MDRGRANFPCSSVKIFLATDKKFSSANESKLFLGFKSEFLALCIYPCARMYTDAHHQHPKINVRELFIFAEQQLICWIQR